MSARRPLSPHAAHLAMPAVHDAVERVLRRRGLPTADIEDLRQNVLSRALVAAPPPPTLEECIALVRKIARDAVIDHFRSRASRAKYDAGPYENPDDRASADSGADDALDPIDARKRLDVVRSQIHAGNITARQVEIIASAADGVPHPAIAQRLNLAPQTVRNELSAARRTARGSWAVYVGAALFAAGGFLLWFFRDRAPVAHREPEIRPDDTAFPRHPTPLELARDMRRRALHECDVGRWVECLAGLGQAAELDPVGDDDPRVQQARKIAAPHILEELDRNRDTPPPRK